jgi:hypothetical protein
MADHSKLPKAVQDAIAGKLVPSSVPLCCACAIGHDLNTARFTRETPLEPCCKCGKHTDWRQVK